MAEGTENRAMTVTEQICYKRKHKNTQTIQIKIYIQWIRTFLLFSISKFTYSWILQWNITSNRAYLNYSTTKKCSWKAETPGSNAT